MWGSFGIYILGFRVREFYRGMRVVLGMGLKGLMQVPDQ